MSWPMQADLNLHCFQKRVQIGSVGQWLSSMLDMQVKLTTGLIFLSLAFARNNKNSILAPTISLG